MVGDLGPQAAHRVDHPVDRKRARRRLPVAPAGGLLTVRPGQEAVGDFNVLTGGIQPRLHIALGSRVQVHAQQHQDRDDHGHRDHQRLAGKAHLPEKSYPGSPDAVVAEEIPAVSRRVALRACHGKIRCD